MKNLIQEKYIQDKFFNILKKSNSNKTKALKEVKEILENPETSQYIHVQQFAHSPVAYGSDLHSYLLMKRKEHKEKIHHSFISDDLEFINNHFYNWFQHTSSSISSEKSVLLVNFLKLAIKNDSKKVIKFLLADDNFLSHFYKYPYSQQQINDICTTTYLMNDTDTLFLLLQSKEIPVNATNTPLSFYEEGIISQETIDFCEKYQTEIQNINKGKEDFLILFEKESLEVAIEQLEKFLSSKLMISYEIAYADFVQNILLYSAKTNNVDLANYVLYSKALRYNANSVDNFQSSYEEACINNSIDVLDIILKNFYKQSSSQDFNLKLNGLGIKYAIQNNHIESLKIVFDYPKIINFNDINEYFSIACSYSNKDIMKFLLDKSVHKNSYCNTFTSPILDEYPYQNFLSAIINGNGTNKAIIIDYLLNDPIFKPKSYKNFETFNDNNIDNKINKIFKELFNSAFINGQIDVIDYFIHNKMISPYIQELINDNLIEYVCSKQIFKIDPAKMVTYLIQDIEIPRSSKLDNFFNKIINYDGTDLSNETIQYKEYYKQLANHAIDCYNTFEFNEQLENQVNCVTANKNNNIKKKI